MKSFFLILLLITSFHFYSCKTKEAKNNISISTEPADTLWKQLSLREKIGQIVMITANPDIKAIIGKDSLPLFLQRYPVGGFFMAPWTLFTGVGEKDKEAVMRYTIKQYASLSKYPPFIVEDYEAGIGHALPNYTKVPTGMALGATRSVNLAHNAGMSIALECQSLGVNWVLTPVADLNYNPLNPITNTRSVGDSPELAIPLLAAQIKGLQKNQVAATIKHFPGDGMSSLDQHLTTTVNTLSEEEWWSKHGKVFSCLIDSGAYSVMVGHIAFPDYQRKTGEINLLPATLSPAIITSLLKEKLKFNGVVVSDALNMGGIQGYYATPLETQVSCFLAGTDVLLWPNIEIIDTLEARIMRGEIPIERLNDAVSRIWNMKSKLGMFKATLKPDSLSKKDKQFAEQTASSISDSAITIISGTESLPLQKKENSKILFVVVAPEGNASVLDTFSPSVKMLQSLGFEVDLRHNLPFYGNKTQDQLKYDQIIFAFSRHPHNPIGSFQLQGTEALTAWMANALPPEKVIAISYGDPYITGSYVSHAHVRINAYSNIETMQRAVIKVLTIYGRGVGVSPVITY